MDESITLMINQNKRFIGIVFAVMVLLLIPVIAMLFTDEVKWTVLDFIVAAALVLGTGFMYELVIRKVNKIKYRIVICLALVATLILIWAELAVGIFSPSIKG